MTACRFVWNRRRESEREAAAGSRRSSDGVRELLADQRISSSGCGCVCVYRSFHPGNEGRGREERLMSGSKGEREKDGDDSDDGDASAREGDRLSHQQDTSHEEL